GAFKGTPKSVTPDFDSGVDEYVWGADSDTLYFTADWRSTKPVFVTGAKGAGKVALQGNRQVIGSTVGSFAVAGMASSLAIDRSGKTLAFARASLTHPNEVFVQPTDNDTTAKNVSHANKALLDEL